MDQPASPSEISLEPAKISISRDEIAHMNRDKRTSPAERDTGLCALDVQLDLVFYSPAKQTSQAIELSYEDGL